MVRQQVLKQYRTFIRTARRLPDKNQTNAIIEAVRADFKQNKSIPVDNSMKIKGLYLYGEKMLKELTQSVGFASA